MAQKSKPEVGKRQDGGPMAPQAKAGMNYLQRKDGWSAVFAAAGWHNQHTGQGMRGYDRRLATGFAPRDILPEDVLRSMYRGDGLGKRVIELPTEAMTSKGFEITGDPEGMVIARMEETGIIPALEAMVRWSRLFGGALGVIGADDGQLYDKPLTPERVRNVHYLHVYSRWRVTFTTSDLYQDNRHPKYGKPEFYTVTPIFGRPFRVHETRTIRMDGAPVDDLTAALNQGWGDSYLQVAFDDLRQVDGVYGAVEGILDDFVTETLAMKGLAELIATEGGEAIILKRLDLVTKSRHATNMRILDGDSETFNKVASSVAGIPDIMDRFIKKLAATTGIPVTLLMGESPAGLNATGEADLTNWDNKVMAYQSKDLKPCIETLARLIFLSRDGYFNGKEPDNWWVQFNPLRPLGTKAKADVEKIEADTANSLIDRGVLTPDEVRNMPDIRKRYDLPEESAAPGLPAGGNPDDEKTQPGDKPDPEEDDDEKTEAGDSLPEDPAAAHRDILEACRGLVLDSRGRRRADSASFQPVILVLHKKLHPTPEGARAWARAYGFKTDSVTVETRETWRLRQIGSQEYVKGSEKYLTPMPGVEIVLGRVRG